MKVCVLDVETTGKEPTQHAVHQLSGQIFIDRELKEVFNFNMRPFDDDNISPKALTIGNVTLDKIMSYPEAKSSWREITDMLRKYVDPFDPNDKFIIVGYNVRFDIDFLYHHARKCGDKYFWSYFYYYPVDVYYDAIAWLACGGVLPTMKDMKLATVYEYAVGRP
jgi:DNA polymerase-3 subunit epsilon